MLIAKKASLEKEISARQAAEQQMAEQSELAAGNTHVGGIQGLIAKPKGQAGEKGFNLMAEMRLDDDKASYLAILVGSVYNYLRLTYLFTFESNS